VIVKVLLVTMPLYNNCQTFVVAQTPNQCRQLPAHHPKVVLMDIQLPKMSGIECTAQL